MTLTLAFQIVGTFAAAFFGAWLTRRTERIKHVQELRSAAYADFVRGVATAAERAQSHSIENKHSTPEQPRGWALVADSRARIAIYGGNDVLSALSKFFALGGQTRNPEGMLAFANLCRSMRAETGRGHMPVEDISKVLFN
jgi:hypothetical protein